MRAGMETCPLIMRQSVATWERLPKGEKVSVCFKRREILHQDENGAKGKKIAGWKANQGLRLCGISSRVYDRWTGEIKRRISIVPIFVFAQVRDLSLTLYNV